MAEIVRDDERLGAPVEGILRFTYAAPVAPGCVPVFGTGAYFRCEPRHPSVIRPGMEPAGPRGKRRRVTRRKMPGLPTKPVGPQKPGDGPALQLTSIYPAAVALGCERTPSCWSNETWSA